MRKLNLMLIMGSFACLGMVSCSKSISEEDAATKQKSTDFQNSLVSHKFKLVAFYSDKPIDYVTTDAEVRSETDLWKYVKFHILDDQNFFGPNGELTIYQNADKFPGNDNATITGNYSVSVSGKDVMMKFVDYIYVPTTYKLQEFDNAYFTIYVDGPSGSKLYSKYARVE